MEGAAKQRHQLTHKLTDHWTCNTHTHIQTITKTFWWLYLTVYSAGIGSEYEEKRWD